MSHFSKLIAAQAAEYGFYLVDAVMPGDYSGPPKRAWRIVCESCNAKFETTSWQPKPDPSLMVRNMHKQGWAVNWKKPPLCPKCAHPRGEKTAMQSTPPTAKTLTPHPGAKLMKQVFDALDLNFDAKVQRYLDGWSDERIAKESHCSIEVVVWARCEAYPPQDDPVIRAMREEMKAIEIKNNDLCRRVVEIQQRLDAHLLVKAC